MRDAGLSAQEGAARIDALHQIVALDRRLERAGQIDGARVVDEDIDAAEGLDGPGDRVIDLGLLADVDLERQRLAAGRLDLLGRAVNGAGQLGMRLDGLGGDRDVGAVARGAQRDGQADAAAEPPVMNRVLPLSDVMARLPHGYRF